MEDGISPNFKNIKSVCQISFLKSHQYKRECLKVRILITLGILKELKKVYSFGEKLRFHFGLSFLLEVQNFFF